MIEIRYDCGSVNVNDTILTVSIYYKTRAEGAGAA